MKTKELINKINNIKGINVKIFGDDIYVQDSNEKALGFVTINKFGVICTNFEELDNADNADNKDEIVKLLLGYALTPSDERGSDLKFKVKIFLGEDAYLNQKREDKGIFISDDIDNSFFKTVFTKSEYEQLRKKYSQWLPKFDKDDPHFEIIGER